MKEEVVKIIGVAVIYAGTVYHLLKPNRHHDVIRVISTINKGINGPHIEGFIDEDYQFLSRKEAMYRAIETDQLNRRPGKEFYQGPELYSEDIW